MSNVLETRVVRHALWVCHHPVLGLRCTSMLFSAHIFSALFIIVVVPTALICEVLGSLVLVCAAILRVISVCSPVSVVGGDNAYILKSPHNLVDVGGRVFV